MISKLTKHQIQIHQKLIKYKGKLCRITVKLRYDDECDNGYNTFSITGTIGELSEYTGRYHTVISGCIHKEIEKYFPELKHLIKWHLCSSDGPLHYIANTRYWVSKNNIEYAKKSTIWGTTKFDTDSNLKLLDDEGFLKHRLPLLLQAFKEIIETIGFVY